MKTLGLLVSLSLSLVTAACSDSTSNAGAESVTGIYAVDSFTHNDAACAVGGDSQLGSDHFAIVTTTTIFGTAVIDVLSCASADDCRAKRAKLDAGGIVTEDFSFEVLAKDAGGVFTGKSADTGFVDGAVCTMGDVADLTLTGDGTRLTVKSRITLAADYPAEGSDGDLCTTDASQQAAAGQTCSQLDNLTAHLVDTL